MDPMPWGADLPKKVRTPGPGTIFYVQFDDAWFNTSEMF